MVGRVSPNPNPLQARRANMLTPKQTQKVLRTLELMIEGRTRWPEMHDKGGLNYQLFLRLVARFPEVEKAWKNARASSAHMLEDRALELAEELVSPNEFSGTQVRAHEVAMNQYRWSAARRDPAAFAEAGANKNSTVVPVQIITSLNIGQPGGEGIKQEATIWETHANVLEGKVVEDAVVEDASSETLEEAWDAAGAAEEAAGDETLAEEEILQPLTPSLPAGSPEALEALRVQLGMPEEVPALIPKRPSPGRPPKRHKDARLTSVGRTNMLKKASKNPVLARALGIEYQPKEKTDGSVERTGAEAPGTGVTKPV